MMVRPRGTDGSLLASLPWTLVALAVSLAPHVLFLPFWITGAFFVCAGWRYVMEKRRRPLPSTWFRALLALVCFLGVLATYSSVSGVGPGSALLAIMAGCSTDRDDSDFFAPAYVDVVVVDMVLVVGRPFPAMSLTRTTTPDKVFDARAQAVSGANVFVLLPDLTRVQYSETTLVGRYVPITHTGLLVQPETTHSLHVITPDGENVTATTTTPSRFSIDDWVLLDDAGVNVQRTLKTFEEFGDGVYFQPENQLVYTDGLLEGWFEGEGNTGYHVGISSLDLDSDFVVDPTFFDEEDYEDLERNISSPIFEAAEEKVRLPWLAIFFQGRYKILVYSVDPNWYDLILTLPEYSNGIGGNTGDNFGRPKFNVNGGIGLFGSASVDSIGLFVLPESEDTGS